MKLTEKQKRFADYYIKTGNATEAYKKAGYAVKSEGSAKSAASRLLTNVNLKAYIEERLKEIDSKRIMSAKEALELLTSIARGETREEVIVSFEGGYERLEKPPDIKDRIKAVESLLKRYPMNRYDELKEHLLEAQIEKVKAETNRINNKDDSEKEKDVAAALRGLINAIDS